VEKPSPPLISPPPAPPSISPSPPAPPSAPPPSAPSAPPTTPAAPPSLPSSLPPSRLSQRAADIFSFFVDTTEKTKEVARQVLVEEDELLDRKQREESVRNWSKDQQSKVFFFFLFLLFCSLVLSFSRSLVLSFSRSLVLSFSVFSHQFVLNKKPA
jgi:hypothetical protein